MNLRIDEETLKIYDINDDKKRTYTLMDIGCYVGYRNRDVFDLPTPYWYLMSYDEESLENEKLYHAEALCDEQGHISRLIIEENHIRRIICLQNENVISDTLIDDREVSDKLGIGKIYEGYEHYGYNKSFITLSEYLALEKRFVSGDGCVITEYPSDERITEYFSNNDQLVSSLNSKLGLK